MQSANLTPRQQAILMARKVLQVKPLFIDTETTGLDRNAEIVEIAIIDHDGSILMDSLIRPVREIPRDAMRVHHISNEMVANARSWPVLWPDLRAILHGRLLAFYNEEFDMRMIRQTHEQFTPWKENFSTFCVMKLFAQFKGEWDPRRRGYRYFKLEDAGRDAKIPLPNSHRAADDTLLTRALLEFIAANPIQ
jgi:DNA polymerase-3 subunit epsilon